MSIRSELYAWSASRFGKKRSDEADLAPGEQRLILDGQLIIIDSKGKVLSEGDMQGKTLSKDEIKQATSPQTLREAHGKSTAELEAALKKGGGGVEAARAAHLERQTKEATEKSHREARQKERDKKEKEQQEAQAAQQQQEKNDVRSERTHELKKERITAGADQEEESETRESLKEGKKELDAATGKGGLVLTQKVFGKAAIKDFEKPKKIPNSMLKKARVPIKSMVPTLEDMDAGKILGLMGKDTKELPLVAEMDGKYVVVSGHSHLAAAKFMGETVAEVFLATAESAGEDGKITWKKPEARADEAGHWQIGQERADWASIEFTPRADDLPIADVVLKKASGILFVGPNGKVLLGMRAEPGEYCGHWGIFGGHHEEQDGTLENTAIREVLEETGYAIADPAKLQLIAKTVVDGTEFTYFVNLCKDLFMPTINWEHTAFGWFRMEELPGEPLIPGLLDVLNSEEVKGMRLQKMHELDVAKAMRAGQLPSPMKFMNMTLYRMRITGTGNAFRRGDGKKIPDEHVFRSPEYFLSEDFLERCNGLAVIFQHPKKKILDSEEFSERMTGVCVCPWVMGSEVWGIAKVYDEDMVTILDNKKMSTSPSVVFHDRDSTRTIALNDGSQLLIEDCPQLLDHLAVCAVGVWDKGMGPAGIESDTVST